jgi:hypothetical protein
MDAYFENPQGEFATSYVDVRTSLFSLTFYTSHINKNFIAKRLGLPKDV